MNCTDFEALLDVYRNNVLCDSTRQRMREHQAQCQQCTFSAQQHEVYRAALRHWQEPSLSVTSKARLLGQLETRRSYRKPKKSVVGFASGFIAASFLAVALVFGAQYFSAGMQPDLLALLDYDDGVLSREITLVINVSSDMPDAELQLSLPADVSVMGQEYLAEVSLPINLKKGKNTVVIPVQLEHFAVYADHIVVGASLVYKNSKKEFALNLDQLLNQTVPQIKTGDLIHNLLAVNNNTNV